MILGALEKDLMNHYQLCAYCATLRGAMLAASYLPWTAQEKLVVIVTDAPCHGKDCHFGLTKSRRDFANSSKSQSASHFRFCVHPFFGQEYSSVVHDPFCDPTTGLTCTGVFGSLHQRWHESPLGVFSLATLVAKLTSQRAPRKMHSFERRLQEVHSQKS